MQAGPVCIKRGSDHTLEEWYGNDVFQPGFSSCYKKLLLWVEVYTRLGTRDITLTMECSLSSLFHDRWLSEVERNWDDSRCGRAESVAVVPMKIY